MKLRGLHLLISFFSLSFLPNAYSQCDFTVSDDTPCGQSIVDFDVINPTSTYSWDFNNDGNIDAFGN